MDMKYLEIVREVFDTEMNFNLSLDPITPDYINDPIIQKLLRQQEEINRFGDICNPGISYGFYHNG